MARKPRIHYHGAINHIIARGNNRENIFCKNDDKAKYLDLLKKYKDKYDFLIYAYALMDNHLHLLIEVRDNPLSGIMQGIQLSYTQYFNKNYGRVGHVFQQRYKAVLCGKDDYLLTLIKYIHANPVKAGLSPSLDYKWSSHRDYIRAESDLVSTEFILNYFGNEPHKAVQNYLQFMQNTQEEDMPKSNPAILYQPVLPKIKKSSNGLNIGVSPEELLTLIAKKINISEEMVLKKSKLPKIARARRNFLYLAVSSGLLTRSRAAEFLGISQSAVTRTFNEIEYNEKFRVEMEECLKKIKDGKKVTK
ncbi:transposase [Pelotomaculum sp. PtaB.Bin117]|uniref:transposase n=1 Tax=Pelotomaculum sp. PtaB.Bin117 TaxID=1811694 RepID=UPI0009D614FC|nr:transposase [Pelotomaculum sp. PtaB.Bin117]OPX86046.1 MAG: Transposase IS200 like protein [Pelotomaculum sp. PtaB.Bin117]